MGRVIHFDIAACKDTEDNVIGIMERSQIAGF